jgi:hypothetical protein
MIDFINNSMNKQNFMEKQCFVTKHILLAEAVKVFNIVEKLVTDAIEESTMHRKAIVIGTRLLM